MIDKIVGTGAHTLHNPHRRLKYTGQLDLTTSGKRKVLLFNDIVLVLTPKRRLEHKFELLATSASRVASAPGVCRECFELCDSTRKLVFAADDAVTCKSWFGEIARAKSELWNKLRS